MKHALITSCVLLAACSAIEMDAPAVDHITPLERACVRDPLDAGNWERLAAALAMDGERERAASMYQQATSLRRHAAQQDYATLKQARDEAIADLPRTQIRHLGPALVEVLRSDAPEAASMPTVVRLEISNGFGATGAAARLARALDVQGLKTVRLSNLRPFVVSHSRIEYPPAQQAVAQSLGRRLNMPLQQRQRGLAYADMRIVLGHDVRYLK